ncbi:hypothetical protein B0H13DRAFT_2343060 [Mycena leptocephala]|nr:hypothetical protein B0H13DRAFT_2343060 [Mycena leptocephala]
MAVESQVGDNDPSTASRLSPPFIRIRAPEERLEDMYAPPPPHTALRLYSDRLSSRTLTPAMLFNRMIACFSPSVPASLRSTWVQHGGSLTHSKHDFHQANVFFCAGTHDPWLQESLIVRHARWISKSVSERFMVPVSKYLLDDQFDLTKIEPAPLIAPASLSLRRELATTVPKLNANTLKRPLGSENHDESCTEIDIRPLKRARIQPAPSPSPSPPQLAIPVPRTPVQLASLFPVVATRTRFYPSPANSSPLKTPNRPNPNLTPRTPKASAPSAASTFALSTLLPPCLCSRSRVPASLAPVEPTTVQLPDSISRMSPTPIKPRPTIAALLRVPRATACVFAVYESYREKEFSCEKITPP